MKPSMLGAPCWPSIGHETRPTFRKQDRLRAATALIDAGLLSALVWSVLAALLR